MTAAFSGVDGLPEPIARLFRVLSLQAQVASPANGHLLRRNTPELVASLRRFCGPASPAEPHLAAVQSSIVGLADAVRPAETGPSDPEAIADAREGARAALAALRTSLDGIRIAPDARKLWRAE